MEIKKILMILLSLSFLNFLIYFGYPHKIGEEINEQLPIYINYHEKQEAPDIPLGYSYTLTQYQLDPGSDEYHKVVELLCDHYYHYSIITTLKRDVSGTDYYDIRYTNKKGKVIWFGFSDQMDMKINHHYAKIGYFSNRVSKQLCKELYQTIINK